MFTKIRSKIKKLEPILPFLPKGSYLVGGAVRDLFLNRNVVDFDIALETDPKQVSRHIADKTNGSFVELDKENGIYRVALKDIFLDFSFLKGKTIKEDLLKRDFTINSIAIKLNDEDLIIDPLKGIDDLKKRIIRQNLKTSFLEDPLRILRAFRFSAVLDFDIENQTLKQIKKDVPLLTNVAMERIIKELFLILETPNSYRFILLMDKTEVLSQLFPIIEKMKGFDQGDFHHLDLWNHSLLTLYIFERMIKKGEILFNGFWEKIQAYLFKKINSERKNIAIIKLASIFHDIGKIKTKDIINGKIRFFSHHEEGAKLISKMVKDWKLSRREGELLIKLIRYHMYPIHIVNNRINPTKRALFRFFRKHGDDGIGIWLLALSDVRATRGKNHTISEEKRFIRITRDILKRYFSDIYPVLNEERLISGNDVIEILKIPPGPMVGKILKVIQEKKYTGEINSRNDALIFLENIKKYKNKEEFLKKGI
ncbi:MAG: CCA tRNA nucleotidyltransferase [Deltaproteobacteria bacterium]|nr:CCA tRNA nucleotidyltransferase [Deltaproteobacteria bacterium]